MNQHPRPNEKGMPVQIDHPHHPSLLSAWGDPCQVASVVPDGPIPEGLNRVPISSSQCGPAERATWMRLAQEMEFEEPPFDPMGNKPAAGAVVVEADGRVWVVAPTNAFGGYKATFPKGKTKEMDLRATALKEVFEESGLRVELFAHLIDITRTDSRTRYYLARRTGGNPADMGWESQAVMLVPTEELKGILNRPVDHKIVDALLEQMGSWASWFDTKGREESDFEAAQCGQLPARRCHWPTLPMPKSRTCLPLDIHLTRAEAECLRLGFIPRMMEQKWFAYFEGDTLFEHRSWTGFCITQVHFIPEGDGLRATHAEVNRKAGQYDNTDDETDIREITERVLQLGRLTPEDRHAEEPLLAGLKQAMGPNYLGSPSVVQGLLEPFFQALLVKCDAMRTGKGIREASGETMRLNTFLAKAFAGEDPDYSPIGTWNSPGSLGAAVIREFRLDADYLADENLFCILSEGFAALGVKVTELVEAWEGDPDSDLNRDLLPKIGELLNFTASVLMGTNTVFFPGRTLVDFAYVANAEGED